ncbi:unnamed protein product [Rotaria magnacalcarata]|uniref:Uncharacterized protein n=1 Tax=Rotaria magnacalcarata TaxID=392030 RepID=A0A8S2PXA3_9BILA|nr:unnamed protein product [Rotaria magnacalcarata]
MSTGVILTLHQASEDITIYAGLTMFMDGILEDVLNIIVFLCLKTFREKSIQSPIADALACYITNVAFRQYHLYGFLLSPRYNIRNLANQTVPLVRRYSVKQLTKIVLNQILSNFIFTSPYSIASILIFSMANVSDPIIIAQLNFTNVLTMLLYYLSFACLFYVYTCASERFRKQVMYALFEVHLKRWRKPRILINQHILWDCCVFLVRLILGKIPMLTVSTTLRFFLWALCSITVHGALRFANYYQDHMVLRRAPQQAISVTLAAQIDEGPFQLQVTQPFANRSMQTITLNDVLFGDVWICSGQSNMQFAVSRMFNATIEIENAGKYSKVRLFVASTAQAYTPQEELLSIGLRWSVASATSVASGYTSAVC